MIRTRMDDNLYQYQFAPEPGKEYGFNLYALLDGRDVLLVDTAYEKQAAAVLADLVTNGYSLSQVLISHFHPDHVYGLKALPEVTVWGSDRWALTLGEYSPQERAGIPPVQGLADSSVLESGPFTLAIRSAPGHSPCSIYTTIGDRVVHVADNLMAANDGTPLLPWAEFEAVEQHIQSLELLKDLAPEVLLLSHGKSITGEQAIEREIDNRLKYLRAVWEGQGQIGFEEATAACTCRFLCSQWHIRAEAP